MTLRNVLFLLTSLGLCNVWAQSNVNLSYSGSDNVIKNPERGLTYKAGYVDLFVDNYTYDGAVTYEWTPTLSGSCNNEDLSFLKRFRRGDLNHSVDLPNIYVFNSNASNSLIEVESNLILPSQGDAYTQIDFLCPLNNTDYSAGADYIEIEFTNQNGDQDILSVDVGGYVYIYGTGVGTNGGYSLVQWLGELSSLRIYNRDGTSNNIKDFKFRVGNVEFPPQAYQIDVTQPVKLRIHKSLNTFTVNEFDRLGLYNNRYTFNHSDLNLEHETLDFQVRTELSHNQMDLDLTTSSLTTPFGNQITYNNTSHSLTFNQSFFDTQTKTQGELNTVELDECFIDKHGISLVELEEYIHFSEGNVLAGQYDIESNSVTRINQAFTNLKNYGLKAHQVTNSDFKMKNDNTFYHVPNDEHFVYLENIMAQTNTEVYSNNEPLVALNTIGWIKDQEEANIYRLSPTWLKTPFDKHTLTPGGVSLYYSEFLPNQENTLRSSHQRSQFRYSASRFNPDFTGNNFLGNNQPIDSTANIQHYQETVMRKIKDYFPHKKMLVDMSIAWQHKFTHFGNNTTYDDPLEDSFGTNPNLGFYDELFSTTYEHLGTICDDPQGDQSTDFNPENKRDLRNLGQYSDRFWMHADMPLYFDDAAFQSSFGSMATHWNTNFQYKYDAFKGMLTATGEEQDPYLAVKKLFRFNYTSFDVTYSNSEDIGKNIFEFVEPNGNGAIDKWKQTPMTQAIAYQYSLPYSTGYFDTRKNVFEYVRDHLGYRLELQNLETEVTGDELKLTLNIENRGFAAPKNPRGLYVVLMDYSGNHVRSEYIQPSVWTTWTTDASLDLKKSEVTDDNYSDYTLEASFLPIQYNTHTLEATFNMADVFPYAMHQGQNYRIALWMPDFDSDLSNSDREVDYAVKLANDPITIGPRGENILASFVYGQTGVNQSSSLISANTEQINQNTTWSGTLEKDRNVTITDGVTLTVTGTLKMATNTRIQVQKGGELVVDGGTITSKCNAPWKGIDVFGDDDLNQSASSGQGEVELKNNARIENAVDAVALIGHDQSDHIAWGTAGGILKASNSTFYNCRRGVEFMAYENYNSTYTTPRRNSSTITNCVFEFDDNFNTLYGADAYGENYFPVGISMWEVHGVLVKGCTFENNISTFNNTNVTHNKYNGHAISLFDASPKIMAVYSSSSSLSNPPNPIDKNEFSGFDIGVYSAHADGANAITVKDNVFEDNKSGVYMENGSNATISKNSFDIPDLNFGSSTDQVRATGVYLKKTTDFELEQNMFEGNNTNTHFDGGLAIDDMYDHAMQNVTVYRNDFNNLGYGFLAYGENGDMQNLNGANIDRGLELGCNDFGYTTDNYQDWYIHANASIAPIQGTGDAPTGNRFSENPLTDDDYGHIFMGQGSLNIQEYFRYNPENHDPDKSDPAKVLEITNTGYEFNRDIDCPTDQAVVIDGNIGTNGLTFDYNDILVDTLEFFQFKTAFEDILNGGIKPDIMAILLDDTKTSKEVRDKLIEGSPYLSDDILIGAITREIPLTQWHLTEVLVWNSRLSSKVMNVLFEEQPLTPYQFNLVKNADNGSQRLLLEMAMHKKEKAINQKRSDYILKAFSSEDDNVNVYNEIIRVYKDIPSAYGVAQCIDAELANKNYAGAQNRLDAYLSNHTDISFDDFYSLKINLRQSNRHWLQLTDEEKQTLDDMEKGANAIIQSKIHTIKRFISGEQRKFVPLPIDMTEPQAKKAYIGTPSDESFETLSEVKYLQSDKSLLFVNAQNGGIYQLINASGQVIETGILESGVIHKDVSYLPTGFYHIRLESDNNKIYHEKFIVR